MTIIIELLMAAFSLWFVYDILLGGRGAPVLPPVPPAGASSRAGASVSIILPTLNSKKTIAACLDSLARLDCPAKEVIVVEGSSTDGTADALKPYLATVKVVAEPPLPAGWIGKSWACHQGYLASSGDYLLFTDADTVHSADSLGRAMSYVTSEKVDLLSLSSRSVFTTTSERLVLPATFQLILDLARRRRVNDDASKVAWAIGQYMLVSRAAYSRLGGHESNRDKIDEDVRLAIRARGLGMKTRAMDGSSLVATTMYDSPSSLYRGLVRNFYGMTRRSLRDSIEVTLGALLRYFLPFVALAYGLAAFALAQQWPLLVLGSLVAALSYLDYGRFSLRVGGGRWGVALLPVSSLAVLAILLVAIVRAVTGSGVSWRGRAYRNA